MIHRRRVQPLDSRARRRDIFGPNVEAIAKADADAGREMPREALGRTAGARDVVPSAS